MADYGRTITIIVVIIMTDLETTYAGIADCLSASPTAQQQLAPTSAAHARILAHTTEGSRSLAHIHSRPLNIPKYKYRPGMHAASQLTTLLLF